MVGAGMVGAEARDSLRSNAGAHKAECPRCCSSHARRTSVMNGVVAFILHAFLVAKVVAPRSRAFFNKPALSGANASGLCESRSIRAGRHNRLMPVNVAILSRLARLSVRVAHGMWPP